MASKSILLPIDNGFILITPEAVLGMYFGKLECRDLINQIEPTIAITATEIMIAIFFEFIRYKDAKNLGIYYAILGFIAVRWVYVLSSRAKCINQ